MAHALTSEQAQYLDFDDNRLMAELGGERDSHFMLLEEALGVRIDPRGNRLCITGHKVAREAAIAALTALYDKLVKGEALSIGEVRAAARLSKVPDGNQHDNEQLTIKTPKRQISPRSAMQVAYCETMQRCELTFGVGPAGTGKTYLAVAHAVSKFVRGEVERLIFSRPAVEAGEQIGFLPGDMKEKVDPYMRPLYDALHDMLHADYIEKRIASGEFEIAPLAFMRGRTLSRAAVILDEAQNATPAQMKMFLTRLGEGSSMVVTGDPSQSDLGAGVYTGLQDALDVLGAVESIGVVRFSASDVVRHPLVARIINAYDAKSRRGSQSS